MSGDSTAIVIVTEYINYSELDGKVPFMVARCSTGEYYVVSPSFLGHDDAHQFAARKCKIKAGCEGGEWKSTRLDSLRMLHIREDAP